MVDATASQPAQQNSRRSPSTSAWYAPDAGRPQWKQGLRGLIERPIVGGPPVLDLTWVNSARAARASMRCVLRRVSSLLPARRLMVSAGGAALAVRLCRRVAAAR